jgi:fructan beta-fructosidase
VLDIGEKDFRDPKVFWHEGTRRWVMAVAWPTQRQVRLYASPNLKDWTHLSDFGLAGSVTGIWECPDLFPLEVEGEPGSQRWVLVVNVGSGAPAGGSGTEYFVGTFDGTRFLSTAPAGAPTEQALWADWGRDFYAATSWSDIPQRDGRRLWLGWMSNWDYANDVPTSPWRGAVTIPRALSLRRIDEWYRLLQRPVKELEALRGQQADLALASVRGDADLSKLNALVQGPFELQGDMTPSVDAVFELTLRTGTSEELILRVDVPGRKLTLDRTRSGNAGFHQQFPGAADAPLRLLDGRLKMHLYVDASSVEIFLNDGETVMTSLFLPSVGDRRIELEVKRGEVRRAELEVWKLASEGRRDR